MLDRRLIALVTMLGCVSGIVALAGVSANELPAQANTKSDLPIPDNKSTNTDAGRASYTVDLRLTNANGNVFFAPKVTVFADQQAEIIDLSTRPFVTAVGEAEGKAVPHIDQIESGVKMAIVVRESRNGVATLDLTIAKPDIEEVTTEGDVQGVRTKCLTVRMIGPVQIGERAKFPFGDDDKSEISVVVSKSE